MNEHPHRKGNEVELTARELADKIKDGHWLLAALPDAYEPVPLVEGRWPRITQVEMTRGHWDESVVSIEVVNWLGWLVWPEEVVKVVRLEAS